MFIIVDCNRLFLGVEQAVAGGEVVVSYGKNAEYAWRKPYSPYYQCTDEDCWILDTLTEDFVLETEAGRHNGLFCG